MAISGACKKGFCSCPGGQYSISQGEDVKIIRCEMCDHLIEDHQPKDAPDEQIPPMEEDVSDDSDVREYMTPRPLTVHAIVERAFRFKLVLVRGTPGCGKSVLLCLIGKYLRDNYPEYLTVIIRDGFPSKDKSLKYCHTWLAGKFRCEYRDILSNKKFFLLLDEAQMTYNSTWWWSTFLKDLEGGFGKQHVIMFASRGSANANPIETKLFTPPSLPPGARIGLQKSSDHGLQPVGILLLKEEAEDLVERRLYIGAAPFRLCDKVIEGLIEMSNGHAGALSGLVDSIMTDNSLKVRFRGVSNAILTLEEFESVFFDTPTGHKLVAALRITSFGRGLVNKATLQDPLTRDIFYELVTSDVITEAQLIDRLRGHNESQLLKTLHQCYHDGWIHKVALKEDSMEQGFVFPSAIHRWNAQELLLPEPQTARCLFGSILELSIACVKEFKPSTFRSRPAPPSATDLPVSVHQYFIPEDHYVAELTRCALKVLRYGWQLVPQYGDKYKTGGGAIDLYLSDMKWGIEVMRNGDRRIDHYRRFLPGGAYYRWVQNGSLRNWLILDFRTTRPEGRYPDNPGYIRIFFDNDFKNVSIFNESCEVIEAFALTET